MIALPPPVAPPELTRAHQPCTGIYAYVPRNHRTEIPFSIHVLPHRLAEIVWLDRHTVISPVTRRGDGSLSFSGEAGSVDYTLACDASGADVTITFAGMLARERHRLVRADVDIRRIAARRRWRLG